MQAWDKFLHSLEGKLGKQVVDKWVRPLHIADFNAENLYLEADSSFQQSWFEEHVGPHLTSFKNNNNRPIHVHFPPTKKPKKKMADHTFRLSFPQCDPDADLENFIVSEDNIQTYKIIQNLLKEPGTLNPLYIQGPDGSGKTHLLQALAKELPGSCYVTGDMFTQHVVAAIRAGKMREFREIYRACHCLLIDDVDHFAKKNSTQEELFHTFNTLHLAGKQIILSSRLAPACLIDIEPRLVSRFEWGIVLPLHPLRGQERNPLVDSSLSAELRTFLLETFTSPQRLMEAQKALSLRLHLDGISYPSLAQARQILADLIREETHQKRTIKDVVHEVAKEHGIRAEDIFGKDQKRAFVAPRQLAMLLCREELKLPYTKIAQAFGKDHTTVMASVKAAKRNTR